jgi:glycosyltransferase involved in cell wall biosynthesis
VTAVLGEVVAASGVSRERITVIPNGVDRNAFPLKLYRAGPSGSVNIGFVGFVREWHGLDEVIAGLAANEHAEPPIRLTIGGPADPRLEIQAQALGVANLVQFTGLQQRQAIPEVLRTFDIALQPRAVCYASPLKLFEYMACGRAIIAPDQPNIREILTDGENAILFDPAEPGGMWRAIRRLASDPQSRERLGRAARRTLEMRNYTWQGNATRVTDAIAADLAQRDGVANATPPLGRSVPHG